MLIALIFANLVTLPMDAVSHVELFAVGGPAYESPNGAGGRTTSGDARLGGIFYLRGVRDDARAFALQPFLQRVSTISLSGYGGMGNAGIGDLSDSITDRQQIAGADASAFLYLPYHLTVSAAVGLRFAREETPVGLSPDEPVFDDLSSNRYAVPASVGVGFRFGDFRAEVFYRVMPYMMMLVRNPASTVPGPENTPWTQPFWDDLGVDGRWVLMQKLDLTASLEVKGKGAILQVGAAYYLTKRLGLLLSLVGGHGQQLFDFQSLTRNRVGGKIAASWWFSRHFGGALSYAPTWTSEVTNGAGEVLQHVFTLQIYSRLL